MQLPGALFRLSLKKKDLPEEISYTIILRKFLYFLKRKLFLYFKKRKSQENFLYFLKRKLLLYFGKWKPWKILYISGNKNPEIKLFIFQETELSYISESDFSSSKSKKNKLLKIFLYLAKCNFLAPSLKNSLYFRREFEKRETEKNQNISALLN